MIRKYKIYIIMGITVLLLFMVLPVDTKGDWEIPWDITLEGEGNDPAFRSSTVMEIFLKNGTAPKDITVFVNQQKINPIWDYEQSTQISFQEEGIYKVHIVHKNGYEEIQQQPRSQRERILQEHGAKRMWYWKLMEPKQFLIFNFMNIK
jgi:hypothetical protein